MKTSSGAALMLVTWTAKVNGLPRARTVAALAGRAAVRVRAMLKRSVPVRGTGEAVGAAPALPAVAEPLKPTMSLQVPGAGLAAKTLSTRCGTCTGTEFLVKPVVR